MLRVRLPFLLYREMVHREWKRVKKYLVSSVAALGLIFSLGQADNAYATTIGGQPQCTADYGKIGLQGSLYWKYSQGTCWNWPSGGKITYRYDNWNDYQQYPIIYLDRWNGSSWVAVAHTGTTTAGFPVNTSIGEQTVTFTREYSGAIDDMSKYRMRWSLPDAKDYTTSTYLDY